MFTSTLRRSLISRPTAFAAAARAGSAVRPLSQTTQLRAHKDAQGKDEMKIESNEYSKSGSDAQSAGVEKAAFDPKSTRPEEEHDTAGREAGVSANGLEPAGCGSIRAGSKMWREQH